MMNSSGPFNSVMTSSCARGHIENPKKYCCWCQVGVGRRRVEQGKNDMGRKREIFED